MSRAYPSGFDKGVTKREYYAAMAMQGDFASQSVTVGVFENDVPYEGLVERAKVYYRMADAMIEAAYLDKSEV